MYNYKALVLKVIDGDTIDVRIDLGFSVFTKQRIRFAGINTPESRTRDKKEKKFGLEVKQFVKHMIDNQEVELNVTKQGKFGRYLAEVFIDDKNLNSILVMKNYARKYSGGKREKWFSDD